MSGIISITDHAFDRAKERLRWNKSTTERMAEKAYSDGISHKETSGRLNKYMSKIFLEYKKSNNTKIYGENVYLFNGCILITIYQIPNNLRKISKSFK